MPTISVKSGLVYEGRLIRKYIEENGKDPITGEDLTEEDLVEIKASEYIHRSRSSLGEERDPWLPAIGDDDGVMILSAKN